MKMKFKEHEIKIFNLYKGTKFWYVLILLAETSLWEDMSPHSDMLSFICFVKHLWLLTTKLNQSTTYDFGYNGIKTSSSRVFNKSTTFIGLMPPKSWVKSNIDT
jgi:hypothetical protein